MISYYERKMKSAFTLWETAVEEGDAVMADKRMADYLNYKTMHDAKQKEAGKDT